MVDDGQSAAGNRKVKQKVIGFHIKNVIVGQDQPLGAAEFSAQVDAQCAAPCVLHSALHCACAWFVKLCGEILVAIS